VTPKLVCEVTFADWTDDEQMRQTVFLGWRDDKDPRDVVNYASSKAGADTVVAAITAAGGKAVAVEAAIKNFGPTRTSS
jgi:ATP-dependent DNA ligase